jgi:hypothetical protein
MEIRWYLTASPWRELVSGNGVKRVSSEVEETLLELCMRIRESFP